MARSTLPTIGRLIAPHREGYASPGPELPFKGNRVHLFYVPAGSNPKPFLPPRKFPPERSPDTLSPRSTRPCPLSCLRYPFPNRSCSPEKPSPLSKDSYTPAPPPPPQTLYSYQAPTSHHTKPLPPKPPSLSKPPSPSPSGPSEAVFIFEGFSTDIHSTKIVA